MKPQTPFNLRRNALAVVVAAAFGAAQAAPVSPTVVHGTATFNQQGSLYTITNTPNTIIDWRSFSVAPGEITRFIQQSADSKVLNRITGQDPSQILGSLQSNGKVFLINPNGVVFGAGARVDVGGLVASSLNISNADFLAGKHNFSGDSSAGKVSNQGAITTPAGGQIFLIAPAVENSGIISSPNGDVVLAAGKSVQLFDSADPNVQVVVSAPSDQALNLGSIVAQGGRVGVFGALVNQRGVINANSAVRGENGKIVLKASGTTLVEAGSSTTATGSNLNTGGDIVLLGAQVGLTGNALVDASGETGGGKVLVGGDYQGKNTAVRNADATYVGKDVVISADATRQGNGGTVVVWSQDATRMHGTLSARGGAAGGDGGLVETSANHLDVAGARVNTSAARGKTGNWLLDPYDIRITTVNNSVTLDDVDDFSKPPDSGETLIDAGLLSGATTGIILQAKNDIFFDAAVNNANNGVSLTAQAGHDINVNAPLLMRGAVTLIANDFASGTADGSGVINILSQNGNTALGTNGGLLTLNAYKINVDGRIDLGDGSLDARASALGGAFTVGQTGSVVTSRTGNGLIAIVADNIDLNGGAGSVGSGAAGGSDTVSLSAYQGPREIRLGDSSPTNVLALTQSDLDAIGAGTLLIGHSGSGNISTSGPVAVTGVADLRLESHGTIKLNHDFTAGDSLLLRSVGALSGTGVITAANLMAQGSSVTLQGANVVDTVQGSAASGNFSFTTRDQMTIGGTGISAANGNTMLTSGDGIFQDVNAAIVTKTLTLDAAGQVSLNAWDNRVNTLSAANLAAISFNNNDAITLDDVVLNGSGADPFISIRAGDITVAGALNAGTNQVSLVGGSISGTGLITAGNLVMRAAGGIGTNGRALTTKVSSLSAVNVGGVNDTSAINISNTNNGVSMLEVNDVTQDGGSGFIKIDNTGGMTVAGVVSTSTGNITLQTHSPLQIDGTVHSDSGNITLTAGRPTMSVTR
ncbi:filamentous hemagglutinin N-terminal domain-containing protein [Duganella sp. P38]|uniref:two-partner secretion domain-containing protein n=1 Tax=Duganella sp. P38 TaxID=3423949 RepID=UPI003D79137F